LDDFDRFGGFGGFGMRTVEVGRMAAAAPAWIVSSPYGDTPRRRDHAKIIGRDGAAEGVEVGVERDVPGSPASPGRRSRM
jgi:hypothetical protein